MKLLRAQVEAPSESVELILTDHQMEYHSCKHFPTKFLIQMLYERKFFIVLIMQKKFCTEFLTLHEKRGVRHGFANHSRNENLDSEIVDK